MGGTLNRRQMTSTVDGVLLGPPEALANRFAHLGREHGIVIVVDDHHALGGYRRYCELGRTHREEQAGLEVLECLHDADQRLECGLQSNLAFIKGGLGEERLKALLDELGGMRCRDSSGRRQLLDESRDLDKSIRNDELVHRLRRVAAQD